MMRISCPDTNRSEREYIIRYIFEGLLKVPAEIVFEPGIDRYVIQVDDSHSIIVEDHFFNRFPEDLAYCRKENIPVRLSMFHFEGEAIPMLYGLDSVEVGPDRIRVGLDIFASAFFMLSRWEEYVLGRESFIYDYRHPQLYQVDEDALFCVRNGIAERPLVHEYEFLIRRLMTILGQALPFDRKALLLITHDVDYLGCRPVGMVYGQVSKSLKKGALSKAWKVLAFHVKSRWFSMKRKNAFSMYVQKATEYGYHGVFLFKACKKQDAGYSYDLSGLHARRVIRSLKKAGASFGFHPSENVYRRDDSFKKEYDRLRSATGSAPVLGRNHRLLHNSQSLRQWKTASVSQISNWGFQQRVGFRCGICLPFPVFNVLARELAGVSDVPFVLMDSSLKREFKTASNADAQQKRMIRDLVDTVARLGGVLCVNWHVNPFTEKGFREGYRYYSFLLEEASKKHLA